MAKTLLLFTIFYLIISICNGNKIKGILPSTINKYTDPFTCLDNSKTIKLSQVNDDYCDCKQDGSDEPGTSACVNGRFYCENIGSKGLSIYSSQVNDRICDCCDGSDESEEVGCVDYCFEQGEAARKEVIDRLEKYKKGIELKQANIDLYASGIQEKKAKNVDLESQIEKLKEEVEAKKVTKETAENAEKEKRDAVAQQKAAEIIEEQGNENDSTNSDAPTEENDENGETEDNDDNEYDPEDDLDVEDDEDNHNSDEEEDDREEDNPELKELKEATKEARKAWEDAKRQLRDVEKEVEENNNVINTDYGKDGEYYALSEKCFEMKTREYIYEICPFKKVSQKGLSGSPTTNMGNWANWEDGYKQQKYQDGQQCWGGPKRSVVVSLSCGDTEEVFHVEEPGKCEYTLKFQTPSACSQQEIEDLQREIDSMLKPQQHIHDEL